MHPGTDKTIAPDRQAELLGLLGTTVGAKYRLERLLGVGGMGGVYAASPLDGSGPVAIKLLSVADPAARQRIAKRFAREARAVSALKCSHIVNVLDAGTDGDRPWLAMELLKGEDLGQRIRREGRISTADAGHIAAQILVALGKAHEAGVVHRDLKPDNVFITPRVEDAVFCKLLDFGMSKLIPTEGHTLALALTKKGMAVGTPFYMAPEQARAAEDIDGRVDLWALGAILFECLAGRPPFIGASQQQILINICTTNAPDIRALRPDVPSKLAKLIARAMARERNDRFLSAWQMLEAVVMVFPQEARLLPANMRTAVDLPISSGTLAMGPIALPEASGPNPALPASASGPHVASTLAAPVPDPAPLPPLPRSRAPQIVALAIGALVLGVGVTLCALALMRGR